MALNVSDLITAIQGWIWKKVKVPRKGSKETYTLNI